MRSMYYGVNKVIKSCYLKQTNRPIEALLYWSRDKDALFIDPPYQRGDVWGDKRRRNLIKSILLGVPIPSLIVNNRMKADWADGDVRIAVIDGRQRITSILRFISGELSVPGEWWGLDVPLVTFPELDIVRQRKFRQTAVAISEGALKNLKQEREVFELVNFGGLAQGESDV